MTSFAEALGAYLVGNFKSALALLEPSTTVESRLLSARVRMRLGLTDEALADVAALLDGTVALSTDQLTEAGSLEAFLLTRNGELERASRRIEHVKARIGKTASVALQSEVWFADAAVRFGRRQFEASERSAWNAIHADLDIANTSGKSTALTSVAPISTTKARALQIIGLIRASQERYHEQYRILRDAIAIVRSSPYDDLYATSVLFMNRSFYARDFGMIDEVVEFELLPYRTWPEDLTEVKVEIDRSLAYLYALRGDARREEDCMNEGKRGTKSSTNRLMLVSDEAFFARQRDGASASRDGLLAACDVADGVNWNAVGSQRFALLLFAQELTFVRPDRARSYRETYASLTAKISPLVIVDKRDAAEEAYSMAMIALSNGEGNSGIELLVRAFETWRDVGFRWRAALASIELAERTNSVSFASYAERESQHYPNSWLAARVSRLRDRNSLVDGR